MLGQRRIRRRSASSALPWIALTSILASGCSDEAPKHWAQLQRCLIGKPLAEGESIYTRLRGVQLAESLESTGTNQDWPQRCTPYATGLYESLPDSGKPSMIKRSLAEQLGCKEQCSFPDTGPPLPSADKLWEAATRAELGDVEIPATPAPRAPAKSLGAEEWPVLSSASVIDEKWSSDGTLWLLLKGGKGLSWCSLRAATAKCSSVQGAPKFREDAPLNFARDANQPILAGALFSEGEGLSRSGFLLTSGKPVELFGEAGHEAYDGVGFAQKESTTDERPSPDQPPETPEFEIQRLGRGSPQSKATLQLSARVRGPEIVDGWFVYVERDRAQQTQFVAKPLGEKGPVFGAGEVKYPGSFPGPFQVCRSKPGAAIGAYVPPIRLLGKKASGRNPISVMLLEGHTWHAPVSYEAPKQVGQFSNFRCGAGWGGFSWLEQQDKKISVTQLVCKSSGCKPQSVTWSQPDLKHALLLGYVQELVLVLYESTAGDVRGRLAKLAQLPEAKPFLAFESPDFGGVEMGKPTLVEGDQTYLLLQGEVLRAALFNGDGAPQPVHP